MTWGLCSPNRRAGVYTRDLGFGIGGVCSGRGPGGSRLLCALVMLFAGQQSGGLGTASKGLAPVALLARKGESRVAALSRAVSAGERLVVLRRQSPSKLRPRRCPGCCSPLEVIWSANTHHEAQQAHTMLTERTFDVIHQYCCASKLIEFLFPDCRDVSKESLFGLLTSLGSRSWLPWNGPYLSDSLAFKVHGRAQSSLTEVA